jgi:beta-mannosidase
MRRAAALLLTLSLTACGRRPEAAAWVMPLEHGWRFHGSTDTTWMPAAVPGTVHTDLLAAGRIADPFTGDQEATLGWIEGEWWTYRRDFDVDPRWLRRERVELVFEGLDTWATVWVNGVQVLSADNMFRSWRVDVAETLRPGANVLEVRFDPPVARGAERATAHPWPIPHQEPDTLGTRAFSRKAAYHFGWDWGPRFVTSGIWRPVRVEAWSGARIVDARVTSMTLSGSTPDTAFVRFAVDVRGATGGARVRVGVRSPDGAFSPVMADVMTSGSDGVATMEATLTVPDPRLWWPRGAGEGEAYLYDIEVDAVQGVHWDSRSTRVGLRTLALVTDADSVGEGFHFEVNGRPVFMRGANVVPPDHFAPRADSAVYARLIADAVAANMNMVRVWGGGVYLPDVFYDLADQAGLLVWQDFMFANALVPGDPAFRVSVEAEAAHQVRRLRRHPSLALWCGNNEVAEGWANWGWREDYSDEQARHVAEAYQGIFDEALAAAVADHDPARPYLPSSPRLGWGDPRSLTQGDSHYWGVWWGMEPFRTYAEKVPRFASEFGFQALPDPVTLEAFGEPGTSATGLDDPVMLAHQKHGTGYETIEAYMARDWPVPPRDSLDAWSYVSQLVQAEGVGLALEAHRRSWPRTGGTLYWQMNDTWPVVSWSSVDSFGRWKALHYRARDVFAPVSVLADTWGDSVGVWLAVDRPDPVDGDLLLRTLDFAGAVLAERRVVDAVPGQVVALPIDEVLPPGVDRRDVVVIAEFVRRESESGPPPRDHVFLAAPADLRLPAPRLEVVAAEQEGDAWWVALTSHVFAYGVRLSVDGVGARYSDNFLHVLARDTVRIRVQPERPTPGLPGILRLRTLAGPGPR